MLGEREKKRSQLMHLQIPSAEDTTVIVLALLMAVEKNIGDDDDEEDYKGEHDK